MRALVVACLLTFSPLYAQETQDGYWFLAKDSAQFGEPSKAFGPYPSEEMCRAAAHDMIPSDREFWTVKHAEEMDRLAIIWAKNEAEMRDKLATEAIAKALKDKKRKPGDVVWVPNIDGCSDYAIYIDTNGKRRLPDYTKGEGLMSTTSCAYQVTGPQWSKVLGCRRIVR